MLSTKVAVDIAANQEKRPVAKLVQEASRFESSMYFSYEDKKVNAKSIMGMMSFIVIMNKSHENGDCLEIIAEGSDEKEAMDNMVKFLGGN